jgi:TonB family protein
MPSFGRRDRYGARVAAAAALAVLLIAIGSLLGPPADPDKEWYEHTGVQGEMLLLDAIDIVSDVEPVTQELAQSLPGATQGVQAPVTERVRLEETLQPVPFEQPKGLEDTRPDRLHRADPQLTAEVVDQDRVKMSRPAQQSSDFVLLFAVNPRYPADVPAALRTREIVVRVNMYVDENGHVAHAYVDRNDGGPRFEDAVLEAVRQWVYRPLVRDGRPTGFWDLIYFVFQIEPNANARDRLDLPGG